LHASIIRVESGHPLTGYCRLRAGTTFVDEVPPVTQANPAARIQTMALASYRLRVVGVRRWRSYLAIAALIGIVGGIALFAIAGGRRTQSAYPRFLKSVHASTLAIDPGGLDLQSANNILDQIAQLPEVEQTRSYVALNTGELIDGQPSFEHSFEALGSVDGRYFDQDRFTPTAGRLPDPDVADEVAINETAAERYGYRVGQVLQLGTYSDEQLADPSVLDNPPPPAATDRATVVGIGLFPEEVVQDDYDKSPLMLLTPAFTQDHIELGTYVWQGLILRNGDADINAVKSAYVSKLDPGIPQFFRTTSIDEFHTQQSIRPISVALAVFGCIALVAALLLGSQAITRQLRFERDERETWRALGASPATAMATSLLPIAIALVVGALAAVTLAVLASPLMPIGPVGRVEVSPGIDFDWTVLGLGGGVLVFVLLLVATVVAWREAPYRVASRANARSRSAIARSAAQAGMPPASVAGLRLALEPGGGSTAVPVRSVIASVTVAIAALVAAITFASSLHALVSKPDRYGWGWGATVWVGSGYGNTDAHALKATLAANPHVSQYTEIWFGSNLFDGQNLPALGIDLQDPQQAFTPTLVAGRSIQSPNEVVLGTATIVSLHKHIGDAISVGVNGQTTPLTIVGTAVLPTIGVVHGEHTSLGVGALVALDQIPGASRNLNGVENAGGNAAFISFKPGTDVDTEIAALRDQAEVFAPFQDTIVTPFSRPAEIVNATQAGSAPALLAAALVTAAAVSLALALASSVRRRRFDLALLKALGFTRRQVGATVAWQASTTVVIAVLIGIPIGALLGRWAWIAFARELNVVPRPEVPIVALVVLVVGALVVANVVAMVPARTARRVRPAIVLRGE
jgi:hypothetical protein